MKKIIFLCLMLLGSLYAEVINQYPSMKILNAKTPIVDIRTPGEWKQTGVLKGAIPIMFFNERGGYDVQGFLKELNAKVDTSKPFAVICHTGNRSNMLSQFLSKELHYTVINLLGGMAYAEAKHLPIVPYKK